jgi:hypothetical protein
MGSVIDLVPADFFSREIQSNKVGDDLQRGLLNTGWDEPDRLCICIRQ